MEVVFYKTPSELREWLRINQDKATELWVGFYKKHSGETGITYAQALDEALCYGWIDGIRKSVDDKSFTIRFTPRKKNSIWSAVNIKRATELAEMGLMQPKGLEAFAARTENRSMRYSYEENARTLDDASEQQLRGNKAAWDFFSAQPTSYRKAAQWWVMSAKRDETKQKRLATLIEDSARGRRLPALSRPPKESA